MSAAFVAPAETWPPAGLWSLKVIEDDGEPSLISRSDGGAELMIVGPKNDDGRTLVVPTDFATIDQADRAAHVLMEAFAAVVAIQAEVKPQPDDGHEHRGRWVRWSRTVPQQRVCELCGEMLEGVRRVEFANTFRPEDGVVHER